MMQTIPLPHKQAIHFNCFLHKYLNAFLQTQAFKIVLEANIYIAEILQEGLDECVSALTTLEPPRELMCLPKSKSQCRPIQLKPRGTAAVEQHFFVSFPVASDIQPTLRIIALENH